MVPINEENVMVKKMWNLGRVRQIIEEALDLGITHAYEDMVFFEHAALIVVFDHDDLFRFKCYFNVDCPEEDRARLFAKIASASPRNKMTAVDAGRFEMTQLEGEEIRIELRDEAV
jgi:hypothetical protein